MLIYTPITQHKTIMFTSPKCACQTIERINLRIFKHPYFNTFQSGIPHDEKKKKAAEAQKQRLDDLLHKHADFSKILITRNPIKRILSCYNYMVVGKHKYTYLRRSGRKWFKDPIEAYTKKSLYTISFTELVDYTLNTPPELLDIHLAPQSFMAEHIEFTHLVKVENLNQELQATANELGLPLTVPTHLQKNKTNYNRVDPAEITEELLTKLYEIYKVDFKNFKHEKLSPHFLQDYIAKKSTKLRRVHCNPIIPANSEIIQ